MPPVSLSLRQKDRARKLGALAGIAAPASFVGAWLVGGAQARDYHPVHDAISQLARVGAPTRPLMTAGFVGFGLLAPWWGPPSPASWTSPACGSP